MSTLSHSIVRECPNCGGELALGALDCPQCHALVHGAELNALAQEAKKLEGAGKMGEAREAWNRSLAMLPPDSKQADWVRERLRALEAQASSVDEEAAKRQAWARKLGPLAPIAIVLAKSKALLLAIFKIKFLFSFFSFIAVYVALWGWRFGVGFAVCILIHELGHFVDIKRRGLPAEMPVFLPGLGAFVRWNALGVTKRQVAEISLAGPLAGWAAAAGCYLLYTHTQDPLWAALARTGAVLNLLNLIPVWALDGGVAANALGLAERCGVLAAALLLWSYTGQVLFFLVAGGAVFRLFTKDKPPRSDWVSCCYFITVMAMLAVLLKALPPAVASAGPF